MRILIVGASAGVGLLCVQQALARGHDVCTLSRNLSLLPDHPRLRKIKGSATNAQTLSSLVDEAQAIVVTLGTGSSTKKTTLYTDFAKALIEVHRQKPVTVPLIVLTGFGAGDSRPYLGFWMGLVFKWILNDVYADKSAMETMIENGSFKWMFVRPGLLTNGAGSGKYSVRPDLVRGMHVGSIPRADVADFLINQAENPVCLMQRPALSSR